MNDREKLLKQVQMYGFALIDASLFLDTHPKDKEALAYFNRVKKLSDNAREDFEKKYGVLRQEDNGENTEWCWACEKWPWEVDR